MRTIIFSLLTLFLFSCEKSEYETYLTYPGIETIDSVAIYPNSPVLITDGKAQLSFIVRAFATIHDKRTIEYMVDDEKFLKDTVFTSISEVKMDRIPANLIKIEASDGQKVENYTFSTTQGAGSEIDFICSINNAKNTSTKVRLIARPEIVGEIVTVPVVFHLIYTTNNQAIVDSITPAILQGFIDRANQVFSGTRANDPNGIDSKVRFEMATKNHLGAALAIPGINKVSRGTTNITAADVTTYINGNLLWNPDKILNIWISDADVSTSAFEPYYILKSVTDKTGLEGLKYLESVASSPTRYTTFEDAGIRYPMGLIFFLNKAGTGSSEHLEYFIGTHFGLIQNYPTDSKPKNFCSDIYSYEDGPRHRQKLSISTPSAPRIIYNSYNIMDKYSSSSSLSYEQALRIRKVIASCPSRMFK